MTYKNINPPHQEIIFKVQLKKIKKLKIIIKIGNKTNFVVYLIFFFLYNSILSSYHCSLKRYNFILFVKYFKFPYSLSYLFCWLKNNYYILFWLMYDMVSG